MLVFACGLLQSAVASADDGFDVTVTATPLQARSAAADLPFTRVDGSQVGLTFENRFSPRDFYPPFFNGGGIASGDINRDGWPDVAAANGSLLVLYINEQGRRFVPIEMDITGQRDTNLFNVALIDFNGDGWLDIYGSTYLQGNFILFSEGGNFTSAGLAQLPRGDAVVSKTASFGDLDHDGDLDIVIGNWFAGAAKKHPPMHSTNQVVLNQNGELAMTPLEELVGETLSTLLSDWSGDGVLDLIVGNDFQGPDFYYLGNGDGSFDRVKRDDGIIPVSTESTMSIDTADYDNDLDLDVFIDQITARATGPSAQMQITAVETYCDDIVDEDSRARCEANIATRRAFFYGANHRPSNVRNCSEVPDETDRRECIAMQVMMTGQRLNDRKICDSIPQQETRTFFLCSSFFEPIQPYDRQMLDEAIPQRMNENVFLAWDDENRRFADVSDKNGVGFTGWSWNAKFADVDNDEWQDIYVAAGSWFRATPSGTMANFFYHNQAGQTFADQTAEFGLQNDMIVSAYTVFDYDRDGDLDFVTNSINGPLWLVRNNQQEGNGVLFKLDDDLGNRDCIGCRITVTYGDNQARRQLREIKAGGGYLSFDEPVAHFGLGSHERIANVEILWSTGERSTHEGPFAAGHLYSLRRTKAE
ncbi:MAG: CRTAC1 family protein [Pseudomonadota bacterium]